MATSRFKYPPIIETTPVIAECVSELRDLIMKGILRPGQKLVEADICRRLKASRASVRETLRVLASEQLVILIPNRGPFVAKLKLKDIEDIHDVWAILTGKAVLIFIDIAPTQLLRRLEAIAKDVKRAAESAGSMKQLEATNRFFFTIMGSCDNKVLQRTAYALVSRINFLRVQAHKDAEWSRESARGIAEIAEKIIQRRPQQARAALNRHIDIACAAAKKTLRQQSSRRAPLKVGLKRAQ